MEKIYMEENQKQKKNNRLSASIGLSFGVAFIAIVSILFVSLSGTTYSLPDVSTLPQSIVTVAPTVSLLTDDSLPDFSVEPYSAQGVSEPVFCVESKIAYTAGITLNRDDEITDEAFIYLLTKIQEINVSASEISVTGVSATDAQKYVKSWLGQTAIWMYLGQIGAANSGDIPGATGVYKATNANALYGVNHIDVIEIASMNQLGSISSVGQSFYKNYGLDQIVNRAVTAYNNHDTDILTVSLSKASDSFTVSGNYLKSDKITVRLGTSGLISDVNDNYSLTVSGAPSGTKVYGINSSGNEVEISDLSSISYNDYQQFYVYVPKDQVDGTVQFSISVKGGFDVYTGYFYEPTQANAQRVTTIKKVTKMKEEGIDLTVVNAPDTASSASSIMYIVGMIVLLSGLGILYVNIKNQKQYQ